MSSDEDRVSYLAGDRQARLDPAERAELDELQALLGDESLWLEPRAGLEDDIVAAIGAEAAGPSAPLPPAAEPPAVRPVQPAADRLSLGHRSRIRLGARLLAVAAAVVLAVGLVAFLNRDRTHPIRFAATLTGTQLAAGASGSATLTQTSSGWRIELTATGLPRLSDGQFYEAWLKRADGSLVQVGTFNEPSAVTLWSGVAPTDFPLFTVTQQRSDAGPESSKRVVLSGTTRRRS